MAGNISCWFKIMVTAMTKRKDTIWASVLAFILNPIDYNTGIDFWGKAPIRSIGRQ